LGGCAQCFFFPEFFCHFWDKHIAKFFGKKFNLFCNFLGEQFTKKNLYQKKYINMYINKKTLVVVVVVVILGFRRIPMEGELG
jgi:hypothetical protein